MIDRAHFRSIIACPYCGKAANRYSLRVSGTHWRAYYKDPGGHVIRLEVTE